MVIMVMVAMVIMMVRLGMVVMVVMTGRTGRTGRVFCAALVCAHVLYALYQHLCDQVQVPWALYRRGSSAIICWLQGWQTRWPFGREAIGPFVEMHRHVEHLTIAISLSYLALNVISAIFALELYLYG